MLLLSLAIAFAASTEEDAGRPIPQLRMLRPVSDAVITSDLIVTFSMAGPDPPLLVVFLGIGAAVDSSTAVCFVNALPALSGSNNVQTFVVTRNQLPPRPIGMVVGGFLTESCAGTLKIGDTIAFGTFAKLCVGVQAVVTTPFFVDPAASAGPWSQVGWGLEPKPTATPPGLAEGSVASEAEECSDARVARLVYRSENETTRATFSPYVLALVSRLVEDASLAQADAGVEASLATSLRTRDTM